MFPSYRACVIRAEDDGGPASDVPRSLQPDAYLNVLEIASKSFHSDSAKEGTELVRTLRDASEPLRRIVALSRAEWKTWLCAAGVMLNVVKTPQPSAPRVASAMFARNAFMREWRRRYASSGFHLCKISVEVLNRKELLAQAWMCTPASDEWPFPASRLACSKSGCAKCKRRIGLIVRGAPRLRAACWAFSV